MTIAEYRTKLREEIVRAMAEGLYDEAYACLAVLQLVRGVDEKLPASFLTLSEMARVGEAAGDCNAEDFPADFITSEERSMTYLKFYAYAVATKLQGEPIDLEIIRARVRVTLPWD
jgi:hypothetical protein